MAETKEWLYTLKVTRLEMLTEGATDEENQIIAQHFAYLQDMLKQGEAILMGRTQNNDASTFGIVILRAPDEAAAREFMANDPAVVNGVMAAELFPYRIALMESHD